MSEWAESALADLVTVQKGRKVETTEYRADGYAPYLGAEVISGGSPTEFADPSVAVVADDRDVLMLWDGERSGLVGKGRNGVVSSTSARLSPREGIDSDFLFYALDDKFQWIQGRRTGTGVPHVPKDLGRILHILYPTKLREQRCIAEILSTVDEAIEQTEKLIAKHQQIKAGLMHDLFTRGLTPDGHLRPSHTKAPHLYKDSPLGPIPKEWEPTAVGASVLGIDAGKSPDCPDRPAAPDEWGVLKVGAVNPMGLQANENKVVLDQGLWNPALLVRPGDLLLSRANTVDLVGLVCYVMDVRDGLMLSDKTLRLRPNASRVSVSFLFWILQDQTIRRQIANLATGTSGSMKNISQGGVRSLAFARPDLEEQGRLTSRLSAAAAREAALAVSAEKLKGLRLALMHDLLTGAVPVPIPEAEDG